MANINLNLDLVKGNSDVVQLVELGNGVVQITMRDEESCNSFSPGIIEGLHKCFGAVDENKSYKAVVLTGYGNYFCSGGTKEELIRIYRRELKFNDLDFFRVALDCEIPVIAAMQGHSIGGGLIFGLYADLVVLSQESIYTTNFMKYGFTPGLGCTLIVPEKLGGLGWEMMYTAQNYRGKELAQRGVSFPIVPRKDVLKVAKKIAYEMSEKPRLSLVTLKQHLRRKIGEKLPEFIDKELAMHEITFHQPEVASRIEETFDKMTMVSSNPENLSQGSLRQEIPTEQKLDAYRLFPQNKMSNEEKILLQLQSGQVSLENAEQLLLGKTEKERQEKAIKHNQIYNIQNKLINMDSSEEILSLMSAGEISLETAEKLLLEVLEPEIKTEINGFDQSQNDIPTTDIAIIGISCRYPGANNWKAFWENLKNGVDSVTEPPPGRWEEKNWYHPDPEHPGTSYSKSAGFLDEINKFDPLFFQISPEEARFIEPQQRIFLEEAYHAIEDAGYATDSLRGKQYGVFVGASTGDYRELLSLSGLDTHRMALTGNLLSAIPARIAYVLDFRGPVVAIDTACSSSLVAVHQACESIQRGESEMAIAGGITILTTAYPQIVTSRFQMVSPDGRCKTFDASASGVTWSEGCGVLFLKRYSQAIKDNDHIYGVIKATGVNYDGNTNGISAPSSQSQASLEEAVYRKFGINPETISYVEAHGTATPLGDPIEVEALTEAFSKWTNKKQFCAIGSVKTNIGHSAAAAGVSGLIKTILCLEQQKLVPSLHFNQANPHIDFENSPFYVNTEFKDWEVSEGQPRQAAVSSFGFSGTNAHVVIAEAPAEFRIQDITERPIHLLTLSAKTEKALEDLVNSYQSYLQTNPELALGDICYTASTGRAHFNYRLGVIASDPTELIEKLLGWKTDSELVEVFSGQPNSESPKIAFLFTGQGSQYINMGQQLYEQAPTFRQALEQCDQILQPYLETSILEIIYPKDEQKSSLVDQTAYTQPAVFALEYALFKLWDSWGIKPNVVMGHSVGEYVAACMAGVFSLEDGLKLIAMRGKLMQKLPSGGEMVSVMASETQVTEAIKEYTSQVTIAAVNGPESIVISGESGAIATICDVLKNLGIKTKKLQVSHAFHSPLMEPMLTEFEAVAKQITYNEPKIPLISNVTGTEVGAEITMAEYWVGHVRQPVKFATSMKTMEEQGYETFLEIGAKPILLGMGRQCVTEDVGEWLPSLRPGVDEWQQMLSSLGKLYVKGVKIDWSGFDSDYSRQKVALPTYPFQRERYWVETTENKQRQHQNTDNINQTQIVQLLTQGNTETLTQQLETTGKLSSEKLKLLPELLDILAQQHQEQLTAATIKNWFYEIQWQPLTQTNSNTNIQPTHWLILADTTGVAEKLAQKLQQQGHEYSLVARGENYQKLTANSYQLNPHTPQEFEQLYQEIQQNAQTPITKLIHLWSIDAPLSKDLTVETLESSQIWGCGSVVHLLQTLIKNSSIPELWLITRGSQSVLSKTENHITGLAASPMWGLGRVVSLEHPQLWGGLIDLEPQAPAADETEMLWQLLANQQEEDNLALRGEETYVARLVNKDTPEFSQGLPLSSDGSYLITGGLGALGLHTAQWLVEKGAKNIVLTGRRPPTEKVSESIKQLEETGCQVRVLLGDVSVEADIGRILEQIQTSMPTLKGIIHAAGVTGEIKLLQELELSQLEAVLRPKVVGGWLLHQLTQKLELDFFVNFSSIASVWGSKGQAHYAAANHFLDGLTYYRRSLGTPSYSINWGPWSGGGMATGEAMDWLNQTGVKPLESEKAIVALEKVLVSNSPQTVVADMNWRLFKELYELEGKRLLLSEIPLDLEATDGEGAEEQEKQKEKIKTELLAKLEAASNEKRQEILTKHIREQVAQVLGFSSSKLPEVNVGFVEMGMDSLMTVELRNQLQKSLNCSVPTTLAFECPNIISLTDYIYSEVLGWQLKKIEQSQLSVVQEQKANQILEIENLLEEDVESSIIQELAALNTLLGEN